MRLDEATIEAAVFRLNSMPRAQDQRHAAEDHQHRRDLGRADRLARERDAHQHRERRVDVRVARRERGPHVAEQPDVRGQAHQRARADEIDDGQGRAQGRRVRQ